MKWQSRGSVLLPLLIRVGGRRGEDSAGSSSKIVEVDSAHFGGFGETLSEVESFVQRGRVCCRIFAHVAKDRDLCAGRDDRPRYAVDPHLCPTAVSAVVPNKWFERKNSIGTNELAESERNHARRRGHNWIMPGLSAGSSVEADIREVRATMTGGMRPEYFAPCVTVCAVLVVPIAARGVVD